ncbi:Zn2/Cys6 DNA-binding protein [Glarea lozoyensis ATCC 20868]|uniref:Zn2/Cys6 DNA-binding protein n=1 Tax=Glarea lozoyensis (strain ATCC 20868 / MF5171) TaxID=1116229 RepID=S3CQN3_GLAL2|nr:Zn2/Cys6 DNA-binding protein [Glarea lozoyensis ATCC 20868]EPE27424.1 Zn2/Cys6 DNA-binding protein [Glarea lozoyensis ATCC 20868]
MDREARERIRQRALIATRNQCIDWEQQRIERCQALDRYFVYGFELDFDISHVLVDRTYDEALEEVRLRLCVKNIPTPTKQHLADFWEGMIPARVSSQTCDETASKYWIVTRGPTLSSLTITSPLLRFEDGQRTSNKAFKSICKVLKRMLPDDHDPVAFNNSLPWPGFRVFTGTGNYPMKPKHMAKLLGLLWVYEKPLDTIYQNISKTQWLSNTGDPEHNFIMSNGRLVGTPAQFYEMVLHCVSLPEAISLFNSNLADGPIIRTYSAMQSGSHARLASDLHGMLQWAALVSDRDWIRTVRVQINRDQPSLENGKALVALFCHWGMPGLARNYVWRDENFGRRWSRYHGHILINQGAESTKREMFSIIRLSDIGSQTTRRSHRKSRTGCTICKERRMKCDEVRPVCSNCSRKFTDPEPCDYRSTLQRDVTVLRPIVPRISVNDNDDAGVSIVASRESALTNVPISPIIDAGSLDPFQTYPNGRVSGLDDLMKHYLSLTVYKSFPWQPASTTNPTCAYYIPLVLNDVVLFHATLQLATFRLEAHSMQRSNVVHLRAECVRLLRDRIENAHHDALSDETLGAVATMAAVEHERGNVEMLKMHMDGLKTMIDLRGGLQAIRLSGPMVANLIFWMFVVSMYESEYPPLDPELPLYLGSISQFEDIAPLHDQSIDLTAMGLGEPVASVLISIQHVSQLVPSSTAYPTAATSLTILSRTCALLSHLLSIPPQASFISEAARFATLLHVFAPWRGLPPDGTLAINRLLHSLISTLRKIVAENTPCNTLLLWIFAVGGVTADGLPERVWFVSHLVRNVENLELKTWEEAKDHIRRVIWHEALCERTHYKLWQEVELRRDELLELEG